MFELNRDQSGSTLALVPVAVLVLLMLLTLTLDAAATFSAQRQLADVCAAAANDAAVVALDTAELYGRSGRSAQVVDARHATDVARARAAPLAAAWRTSVDVDVTVDGATVTIALAADAPLPVGRPGRPAGVHVTASCRATSVRR